MKKAYYFAIVVFLIFIYKSAFADMDQYCAKPHAFLVGQVQNINLPDNAVAKLCANDDSSCPQSICNGSNTYTPGSELWGFIPTDSLAYLKYLANPNYCHIYYQDLTPYIFRANGRIILIGGMRMGGATSETTQTGFIQTPLISQPPSGQT